MRNFVTACVASLVLFAPPSSEAAVSEQEVADLRQQVQALLARVQQLESRNSELAAGSAPAAPAGIEKLESRVSDLETTSDRQADQFAQALARDKSMDWAGRVKLKGDFRVREEIIQEETKANRDRQRIRARLGIDAKVSDTLSGGFQLATGSTDDPRSTNATLTDSNQRKGIQLDLACFDQLHDRQRGERFANGCQVEWCLRCDRAT